MTRPDTPEGVSAGDRKRTGPPRGHRDWVRIVTRLVAAAVFTYITVCIMLTALQARLIYFPTRGYDATPSDVGLAYERVTLQTADGVNLAAWYLPHPAPRGSVIFFHGNAGNMADRLHTLKELHRLRLNVLILDYRGYGDSGGRPTEEGTYLDAMAGWRHLIEARGHPPDRVVLFGRSLGGAVAIELARRVQDADGGESAMAANADKGLESTPDASARPRIPAGLVVESTFTSLVDVGRLHYPFLPVSWMLRYRYESVAKVPHIRCPKLFIHGRDDDLIPIANGRALFYAAAEPKTLIETPGSHNEAGFTYSPEYTRRLASWLDQVGLTDQP